MGVDIGTYRSRIGTFHHGCGVDVITLRLIINYGGTLRSIGAVAFIGVLLLMAGVESNPGPRQLVECDDKETQTPRMKEKETQTLWLESAAIENQTPQIDRKENQTQTLLVDCMETEAQTESPFITQAYLPDGEAGMALLQEPDEEAGMGELEQVAVEQAVLLQKSTELQQRQEQQNETLESQQQQQISLLREEQEEVQPGISGQSDQYKAEVEREEEVTEIKVTVDSDDVQNQSPRVASDEERNERQQSVSDEERNVTQRVHRSESTEEIPTPRVKGSETPEEMQNSPTKQRPSTTKSNDELIEELGLGDWFPGKITMQHVLTVDAEDDNQLKDIKNIPWLMLKRIMLVNSEARDQTVAENCVSESAVTSIDSIFDDWHDEAADNSICPLDVLISVLHCCDPMLKQVLYKKMFSCSIALPLVHIDPVSNDLIISVWPLRSLVIEWKTKEDNKTSKGTEISVLKQATKIIIFSRFGRPPYSKSKLQNDLLSDQSYNTFYNKDSVFGMMSEKICNGYMECSWYLPTGHDNDLCTDALMFVNQRGSMETCNATQIKCIQTLADILVIVIDVDAMQRGQQYLNDIIRPIKNVIFIITNVGRNDMNAAKEFLKPLLEAYASCETKTLKVVTTHKNGMERNTLDMKTSIQEHISVCIDKIPGEKLSKRIKAALEVGVKSDENSQECQCGKQLASGLIMLLKESGPQVEWKSKVTAAHHTYSRQIRDLDKKLKRARSTIDDTEQIKDDINKARLLQTESISGTTKKFINVLVSEIENKSRILFYIAWLKCKLDDKTRKELPPLMEHYFESCEKLQQLRSANANEKEISEQEIKVNEAERTANDVQFSIEHLFKEIGQVYAAIKALRKHSEDYALPAHDKACSAVANLIVQGQAFEILDGESSNIPVIWVQDVFAKLSEAVGNSKILTLSVLGLQSSGKSTLLNTMFGLQLDVSSGRCTRGIHVHLIPVKQSVEIPFGYILVIDSEGLRAPELGDNKSEHDNEMATFVIGLSDITLLNVMGENTSEMKDILQVTVYALLRFRMANKSINMRQKACLVHQNVTAVNAAENMNFGIQKLIEGLNKITKEAAAAEGMADINQFSQIIEFNPKEQVWYLPNFLQGNPPMTVVNVGYSNIVGDLRSTIVRMMGNAMPLRTISEFRINVSDMWKGVSAEDFVFSFKNSVEIKAYINLEQKCQDITWTLESVMQDKKQTEISVRFAACENELALTEVSRNVLEVLALELSSRKEEAKSELRKYFDENEHKELIIAWRTVKLTSIDLLTIKLEQSWNIETDKRVKKRRIEILISTSRKRHEEILYQNSIDLARKLRGEEIQDSEIQNEFENIWHDFVKNVENTTEIESANEPLARVISTILFEDFFPMDKALLNKCLKEYGAFDSCPSYQKLKGTFNQTGLNIDDINVITIYERDTSHFATIVVTEKVDQLFHELDSKITTCIQLEEEMRSSDVKTVLHEIEAWMTKMTTEHDINGFTCKQTFKAKVFVHVSSHIHEKFETHNKNFNMQQKFESQLKTYKDSVKVRFYDYLNDRKSEATAAKLFCKGLKPCVSETVRERLPGKVEGALWTYLPANLKYHLIIKIIEHLADENKFEKYMKYIKRPKAYADDFIKAHSEDFLFGELSGKYYSIVEEEITKCMRCVKESIEKCTKDPQPDEEDNITAGWISRFFQHFEGFALPPECLREAAREQIENVENFKENLMNELSVIEQDVLGEFKCITKDNVTWVGENPYMRIINKIWGCIEVCQFCAEPCRHASSDEHMHDCIQHRPSGCNGIRTRSSKKVSLSSCNFDVQSDQAYLCSVLDYKCNEGNRSCPKYSHLYKEYRTFLPKWDIEPSTDMESTCKFWLWFMANFKKDLASYYSYVVSDVPSSWSEITKEEALESFRLVYSV